MTDTDRDLLVWAAKAVGLRIVRWDADAYSFRVLDDEGRMFFLWNPIADDGDALRLEVVLRLEIEFGSNFVNVGKSDSNEEWHLAREEFGDDPLAATRRAIVRAAAYIGRSTT